MARFGVSQCSSTSRASWEHHGILVEHIFVEQQISRAHISQDPLGINKPAGTREERGEEEVKMERTGGGVSGKTQLRFEKFTDEIRFDSSAQ